MRHQGFDYLERVTGIGRSEHDLAITSGETVVLISSAKDLNSRWNMTRCGRRWLVMVAEESVTEVVVSFHCQW
jgi:hypothetical protein